MGFISQSWVGPRSWSRVFSRLREIIMTVLCTPGLPQVKSEDTPSGEPPELPPGMSDKLTDLTAFPPSPTTPKKPTRALPEKLGGIPHHNGFNQLGRSSLRQRKEQLPDETPVDQWSAATDGIVTNKSPQLEIMEGRSPPADTLFMLVNEMMSSRISFGMAEVPWIPSLWSRKMSWNRIFGPRKAI